MTIEIRAVSADEFPALVPGLADLLVRTVAENASLGFLPPLAPEAGRRYWTSLCPELRAETRLFVGAFEGDRIVGSGQLALSPWPNAQHRAEVQKLFVDRTVRGTGVGRCLMAALHGQARQRGRSLILLNARRDVADRFYKPLGYNEIGVIPGYSTGSDGRRIDTVSLYKELQRELGADLDARRIPPEERHRARAEQERPGDDAHDRARREPTH